MLAVGLQALVNGAMELLPRALEKQNKPQALPEPPWPSRVCFAPADSSTREDARRQKQVREIIASRRGHCESHTPSVIRQTPNLPFQAEVCVEPKVQLSKPARRLIPPPALIGVQKS